MIYTGLNNTGEVEAIYGHLNGVKSEVSEVYGSIDYNDPIFYSRKTLAGTSPLTFKGLGQPLKDYHIFGETIQNGTPSPDYPVDVQGVGEWSESILDLNREYYNGFTLDTTKWMKGASSTKYAGNAYLVDASITDGKIVVNSKNAGYGVSVFIPAKPNTKYSIYWICNKTTEQRHEQISVSSRDSNGNATGVNSFHDPSVYATESNAKYLNVVFRCRPSYGEVEYSDILICESDTVVPYGYKVPVTIGNVTTPIYIGSDPLYRVGDYADEIDFGNQRIIRRIKKMPLTGWSENWTISGAYTGSAYAYFSDFPGIKSGERILCTDLQYINKNQYSFGTITADSNSVNVWLFDESISTYYFREYLAQRNANGNSVVIWYVITTPEVTSIAIPTLATITGDNTLTVDTTVKPSAVSITGHIKPTGYGQLVDVNDVDIQDSTGEPIYIQG